jgi:hypothetical protein
MQPGSTSYWRKGGIPVPKKSKRDDRKERGKKEGRDH